MASEKQVSANRRNAAKSTGPTTHDGKLVSRRNAMRHGLTAATVVPAIEDAEEFECFAAAIRADYQPISAVEQELVARLTSLLWRLRRSTLIETNLFQLQARLARDRKLETQGGSDTTSPGWESFIGCFTVRIPWCPRRLPQTIPSLTIMEPMLQMHERPPRPFPIRQRSSCGYAISTASPSSGSIGTRRLCGDK
jgi:hypothetical protein